jgi:hypothetical protein
MPLGGQKIKRNQKKLSVVMPVMVCFCLGTGGVPFKFPLHQIHAVWTSGNSKNIGKVRTAEGFEPGAITLKLPWFTVGVQVVVVVIIVLSIIVRGYCSGTGGVPFKFPLPQILVVSNEYHSEREGSRSNNVMYIFTVGMPIIVRSYLGTGGVPFKFGIPHIHAVFKE